jgi:hypothetical protein
MALPSSGVIKLSDIKTEFNGVIPTPISSYYRNGTYVTPNNSNVPVSGIIKISNFYSAAKAAGITWSSASPNPVTTTLLVAFTGVAYGGGVYAAGGQPNGSANSTFYSTDGATWTTTSNLNTSVINGVRYLNGQFVAFRGSTGELWTSTNGYTWTLNSNLSTCGVAWSTNNLKDIGWDGTYYVAVCKVASVRSTNLTSWTVYNYPVVFGRYTGPAAQILYAGGKWWGIDSRVYYPSVMVSPQIWSSTDNGATWLPNGQNFGLMWGSTFVDFLRYNGSQFIALGSDVGPTSLFAAYSTGSTGAFWTNSTFAINAVQTASPAVSDVIWGGANWVIASYDVSTYATNMLVSYDFVTFTQVSSAGSAFSGLRVPVALATNGSGQVVCAGTNGYLTQMIKSL